LQRVAACDAGTRWHLNFKFRIGIDSRLLKKPAPALPLP
jgi:hypothetical protein